MKGILKAASAVLFAFLHSSTAHSVERNPLNYVSRLENPVLNTPSQRIHAHTSFDLTFQLHDGREKVRLSLAPNHDVISNSATIKYLRADGSVRHEEAVDRALHKVFQGDAFLQQYGHHDWINVGWARITVHRDGKNPLFEGAFRMDGNHHHIQTAANYRATQHRDDPEVDHEEDEFMVVWRDSDIVEPEYDFDELRRRQLLGKDSCMSDQLDFNFGENHPIYTGLDVRGEDAVSTRSLLGRQNDGVLPGNGAGVNLTSTIGNTAGCPVTRKVALIGIATDCNYAQRFNSSSDMRANIIQQVNSASALYESTFNISLGIQNLTVNEAQCPGTPPASAPWNVACGPGTDITKRLSLFSAWRGQFNDTNAYWTLLSTCNTDAAVGLAWLGQVCSQGSSTSNSEGGGNETIAGANVVIRTSSEWQVFAHESGHTFGAVHDCVSTTCSDGTARMQKCCPLSGGTCDASGRFIMNPSTGNGITQFSPCSVGNICSALGRNSVSGSCLTNNRNVVTISGSQCGNGIVEQGEDCDCGGETGCGGNRCCDAKTCKFTTGSQCDPSNEDCCAPTCQFAGSGTVCRASAGSCDPAETCSGSSGNCPADVTAPDGTSCGADGQGLQCASGQCTSRDLQCRTLMGSITTSNNTWSCPSQTGCLLTCGSSQLDPNRCYNMNQYFLDGTPCTGGGKCSNGQCLGGNFATEVGDWFSRNKNIVIPVASVIGGLILISILSCCISSCRRRRRVKRMPPPPPIGSRPPPVRAMGAVPQQQSQTAPRSDTRSMRSHGSGYPPPPGAPPPGEWRPYHQSPPPPEQTYSPYRPMPRWG